MSVYNQWLNRESEWSQKLNQKQKKRLITYVIGTPLGGMAGLFAIGFLAGGGMELAVNNIKYGLLFGVAVDILLLLVCLPAMPGKRYQKQLVKTVEKNLPSQAEREEFASQMMGVYGPDTVQRVMWKDRMTGDEQVWVTKDYVLRTTGTGNVQLIGLKQTEQLELDARTSSHMAGNSDMKIRYQTAEFPIVFRQKQDAGKPVGLKEKLFSSDPCLYFDSREIRDKVVEALRKVSEPQEKQ